MSVRSIGRALPTLDELPSLVASYEAAGLGVDVDIEVAPTRPSTDVPGSMMPPSVGLTLYRVAQESLANAARHGTGSAQLRLSVDTDRASLTVRNQCRESPPVNGTGTGLLGMRERVTGLGGSFRAGRVDDSGGPERSCVWEVDVRVSLGAT